MVLMLGDIAVVGVIVLLYMITVFVSTWSMKRLDIVDIAWGGAFVVAALASFLLGSPGLLQYLVTTLVIVWAVRLSSSILRRFLRSSDEDARYKDMRKTWKGSQGANAFFRIFLVQGILATIVSTSVIVINTSGVHELGVRAFIGLAVWVVGFIFEAVGDKQLRNHLADPKNKGKLMTSGLWRYTRHPNYFGEAAQWWGIFVIALNVPFGWATIIAPLAITILLLFISGVPLTEKRFEGKPGWAEYKKRTSVFIPLPPRK
jgi:steroid 5-alpha reductase family enzyme